MTANIIRLPSHRERAIWLTPSRDDDGCWLVLHQSHGWLHGSSASAAIDAQWLSGNTQSRLLRHRSEQLCLISK
jgi:hypothetical protein